MDNPREGIERYASVTNDKRNSSRIFSLLFKIITTADKETTVLAIPDTCADKIITLYHSSLFAGHQGIIKIYLTINDKFLYLI